MAKKSAAGQYSSIGERLRNYRKAAGLTQGQLARTLDITQQQISKYESGEDRVSLATLTELAKLYGKPPEAYIASFAIDDVTASGMSEPPADKYLPAIAEPPPSVPTKAEEAVLLRSFRDLNSEDRDKVRRYIEALLRKRSPRR